MSVFHELCLQPCEPHPFGVSFRHVCTGSVANLPQVVGSIIQPQELLGGSVPEHMRGEGGVQALQCLIKSLNR